MPRACVIVLDAVGAGALPDADAYGDEGSDTLGNVARAVGGLDLPNLEALGLGNVEPLEGCPPQPGAPAVAGRLFERSKGKDTTAGHWELMGIVTPTPFPTYAQGFPHDVIDPFMHRTGRGVLGNKPASGTEIIQELGEEHQRSGKWIVYTSADSVFQIAAHEPSFGLERLYELCELARELLMPYDIGRVIARPFEGDASKGFTRTTHRRDYSLAPPAPTLFDAVRARGGEVVAIGKIADIFAHQGVSQTIAAYGHDELFDATLAAMADTPDGGLICTNFVDFDMVYGHRRDIFGYAGALEHFDRRIPEIMNAMR
ncbi:MAG: phosphopentomutase, partial [Gaiellaceae bacterium]